MKTKKLDSKSWSERFIMRKTILYSKVTTSDNLKKFINELPDGLMLCHISEKMRPYDRDCFAWLIVFGNEETFKAYKAYNENQASR